MDPAGAPAPASAATPPSATAAPSLPWIKAAALDELKEGMRKRLPIRGRDVTLLLLKDSGGPLTAGNIEELASITCLICPWHGYAFNLETGESLYFNMDDKLCSKGRKQRVHPVEVRHDGVYVQMLDPPAESAANAPEVLGQKRDSDHYAYKGLYRKYDGRPGHIIVQFEEPSTQP